MVKAVAENVTAVATEHSEQAISEAVAQIEQEIEEENTWLANELMEVRRDIANLGTSHMTQEQANQILSRLESLNQKVESLQSNPQTRSNQPNPESGEGQREQPAATPQGVPEPPPPPVKKKRRMI